LEELWNSRSPFTLVKGKVGEVVKVGISYDDGDEEESNWPDKDIAILGSDDEGKKEGRKKPRKDKIQRRVDEKKVNGESLLYCGEGECEYYSKDKRVLKQHKSECS